MKQLSIIIPIYNMEKYLSKCLSSLIVENENLQNTLEIIAVIDGATDKSSSIAHLFQKKYPGIIKVIDKENGNYGSCINRGLIEATGKYIRILDADDSFNTNNFIKYLKLLAQIDSDLILTDYNLVDNKGNILERRSFDLETMITTDIVKVLKPVSELEMHAITYRRQILLDINYHQTEGISYTDTEWAFIPLMAVNTVCYVNLQIYNYLVGRPGQTMDISVLRKSMPQMMTVYKRLMQIYNGSHLDAHKNSILFDHRIDGFMERTYGQTLYNKVLDKDELKRLDEMVKKYKPVLYEALGNLNDGYVWYVKQWRRHDYSLPLYYWLIVRFVQLKRKYL